MKRSRLLMSVAVQIDQAILQKIKEELVAFVECQKLVDDLDTLTEQEVVQEVLSSDQVVECCASVAEQGLVTRRRVLIRFPQKQLEQNGQRVQLNQLRSK